ncbi:WhiB family transcriptional regulator [Streptomyces sp. NPDC005141]
MDNWRDSAACRTVDPDLFFPIGSTGPALLQIQEAKAVCAGCPVRDACLTWALDTGQSVGVWGGASEAERRTLARRRSRRRSQDTPA